MRERLHLWRHTWRFMVVGAITIALAFLMEAILLDISVPPRLGVKATPIGDRLIVTTVVPGVFPWEGGVRPGQEIIALDGHPVTPGGEEALLSAQSIQTRTAEGQILTSTVAEASLLSKQWGRGFIPLVIAWVAIAVVVFVLATDVLAAAALLSLSVVGSVTLLTAIATPFGSIWTMYVENIGLSFVGPSLLCFFLVFPVNRLRQKPLTLLAIALLALGLVISVMRVWVGLYNTELVEVIVRFLFRVEFVVCAFSSIALILVPLLRKPSLQKEARRALGFVALGTIAGLLPFCLLSLVPQMLGTREFVSLDVSILSLIAMPLSLGVAVLSRQFFGISHIIQRSMIALMVWFVLLAGYAVFIDVLSEQAFDSSFLNVAIVAFTFPLLQHFLRRWLERRLLLDVYDYSATLRELAANIVIMSDLDAIANYVLEKVSKTIDLQWAVILLKEEDAPPLFYSFGRCPIDFHEHPSIDLFDTIHPGAIAEHKALGANFVPLIAEGIRIGTFGLGPKRREPMLNGEDQALLATLSPFVGTALRSALLVRQLGQQVELLGERETVLAALNTRLMKIQEDVQHQISMELHDDPLQRALLLARSFAEDSRERQDLDEIISSLRAICTELHPPVLDDFGLVPGLERLANSLCARSDLYIELVVEELDGEELGRLDHNLEVALYHIAQEALNNTIKHANATKAKLKYTRGADHVNLSIIDNGCGFNPQHHHGDRLHLGIIGMRERLRPWVGTFKIYSPPESGTVVSADVALHGNNGKVEDQELQPGYTV